MKKLIACVVLCAAPGPGLAWNGTGHMVTARLAWRQLTEEQRGKVLAVLKKHPHYGAYLAAGRPEGFTEDEWAFLRAATWADWVRGRRAFDHPTWHYINYPIIEAGSALKAADHEPPAREENAVNQLAACVAKIRAGTDEEKAVYTTWLFHLVGDIHQPLHCTSVFSERFPKGDKGGNLALVRLRTGTSNLHSLWDGLPGRGATAGGIGRVVAEVEQAMKDRADDIRKELGEHRTFESWGREGWELCKHAVYLDGQLKVAARGSGRAARDADAPEVPADYLAASGRVARVQLGKAGIRLADQIKELFP
jgi:hypothetical protein